eukprot:gb/GECG01004793.1/.p1 GENE.gb/GECG01004793.1/~~gb/GECG01004793.1/.p1  ORF type:complete len:366 (+),score=52.25 gb/GECG01004793.1/:1-1098(+)
MSLFGQGSLFAATNNQNALSTGQPQGILQSGTQMQSLQPQQQQQITKETKVKDLPQDVKDKVLALHKAIQEEAKMSSKVTERSQAAEVVQGNTEPRDMSTLIGDCGQLNKSLRYMNLKLENEVHNFEHKLEDLKQRVKSDYRCVERTRYKLDCAAQGTPQPLDLPSNYFTEYVRRSEEWLHALEQQLEDLEHVFLSELEESEQVYGSYDSSGLSNVGNFASDIWSKSLLNSSVPYNSYTSSLSGSRSQRGSNNTSLQLAVANSESRHRPLQSLERREFGNRRRPRQKDPYEVIKQTIRTQHAAVLQLAGDTVSVAHDSVERMKRSLLELYRHMGDSTYDPFKEADEKLREEEKYRLQELPKALQQ